MDARKRGFASGGKYGEPSGSAKAENGSVSSDVCGRCGDRLNRSSGDGDQRWQLISQIEFTDHLGKTILPTWFNISERPHVMRGLASSPFDSEGVRTQDLEIITDGVLATYLLTSYAARKMNMTPTGHAGGIHNWYVKSTGQNYQQMLKELGTYYW